jgi:hypothetical protein
VDFHIVNETFWIEEYRRKLREETRRVALEALKDVKMANTINHIDVTFDNVVCDVAVKITHFDFS